MTYSEAKKIINEIVEAGDTPPSRAFDMFIIGLIALSILIIIIDSVPRMHEHYGSTLLSFEVVITLVFTIEYLLRIWSSERRLNTILKPMSIIDLLAILPLYISFAFPVAAGTNLTFLRSLRLLRIFRSLKLVRYLHTLSAIRYALVERLSELIAIFSVGAILLLITSCFMYFIEPGTFESIPKALWWAAATMTTVGYGDIYPVTFVGRILGAFVMALGIAFIALPTAVIGSSLIEHSMINRSVNNPCPNCNHQKHHPKANYCLICGARLPKKGG